MEVDRYIEAASHVTYNPDDGTFRWKRTSLIRQRFHLQRAGSHRADGYVYITLAGRKLLAHRLAWLMAYGELPPENIDHINMDRSDNRIANLRSASVTDNNRNRRAQSNNTSGYKGVTFHKGTGKYHAKICVNKRRISLGYFDAAEHAALAYQKAAKEHHGDFARVK